MQRKQKKRRRGYTAAELAEVFDRWVRGESSAGIARALNRGWECVLSAVALRGDPPANQVSLSQGANCGRARGDLAGDCFGAVAVIDRPHPELRAIDAETRGAAQRWSETLSSRRGGQASPEEGTASETMPA